MTAAPKVHERWAYKPNRGTGSFVVTAVSGSRVTLRGWTGRTKTVSLRTLRGDYYQVQP